MLYLILLTLVGNSFGVYTEHQEGMCLLEEKLVVIDSSEIRVTDCSSSKLEDVYYK
jgi:hypothetical protein